MKIVTASEMRAADEATFREIGVPSRAVMECAGREVSAFLLHVLPERCAHGVLFVAGAGNNGGDAYVAARALYSMGIPVKVVALKLPAELAGEALNAAQAFLQAGGTVTGFTDAQSLASQAGSAGVLVDGIYGTGMRVPATGKSAALIDAVNRVASAAQLPVVAIDIPSGLSSDTGQVDGPAVNAALTLALQCLKVGHVTYPAAELCGEVFVADIGISEELAGIRDAVRELMSSARAASILNNLSSLRADAHKGSRGHVAVVGGSSGKLGAPMLAGSAALKLGAGLVTIVIGESNGRLLQSSLRELMCEMLAEKDGAYTKEGLAHFETALKGKAAIIVGPGLGQSNAAKQLVLETFRVAAAQAVPLVVDADALNLLSANSDLKSALPKGSVLTPHPGEMARLLSIDTKAVQADRFGAALRAAQDYRSTVVLKGARTITATPEGRLIVNPSATSVLGTGGSGDVLAGIISAFIAQRTSALDAALLGVFVHGTGGELLDRLRGRRFGVLATDLADAAAEVANALADASSDASSSFLRKVLPQPLDFLEPASR